VIEPREHDPKDHRHLPGADRGNPKLKREIDLIQAAINDTKQEIATLHVTGFRGPEMRRVTDELDAIVGGTESATERILNAGEEIDQCASTLTALVKSEQEHNLTATSWNGWCRISNPATSGPHRAAHQQGVASSSHRRTISSR